VQPFKTGLFKSAPRQQEEEEEEQDE